MLFLICVYLYPKYYSMTTKTLFLALFLLTLTLSLKQSEIGRNDWHLENIGQVSFVQLVQNKLFYLTQENILGHLRLDSG